MTRLLIGTLATNLLLLAPVWLRSLSFSPNWLTKVGRPSVRSTDWRLSIPGWIASSSA